MHEIPMPELLDPERHVVAPERDDMTLEEHRNRASALDSALGKTCHYGQALRQQVLAAATYLETAVPADTDDVQAWTAWRDLYGSLVSCLAGPAGDGGYGAQEATRIAEEHGATAAPA